MEQQKKSEGNGAGNKLLLLATRNCLFRLLPFFDNKLPGCFAVNNFCRENFNILFHIKFLLSSFLFKISFPRLDSFVRVWGTVNIRFVLSCLLLSPRTRFCLWCGCCGRHFSHCRCKGRNIFGFKPAIKSRFSKWTVWSSIWAYCLFVLCNNRNAGHWLLGLRMIIW